MLPHRVVVVTGASKGAGKGVALAFGEAGATVYVTGRSSRFAPAPHTASPAPGTVEDTAEEVTRRGGKGIPVVCDHTVDTQVAALFERVQREQQRLHVLVNAAWGGNELAIEQQPFWQLPVQQHWDNMFSAGVRCALTASHAAAAMMVQQGSGLIVNVTAWNEGRYTGHLMYDLAKASLNRLAFGMAQELQQHKVAAVAVAPGWMRTERVLAAFGCSNDAEHIYGSQSGASSAGTAAGSGAGPEAEISNSEQQHQQQQLKAKHWTEVPDLAATETPLYLGRAVVALAGDPEGVMAASTAGNVLYVADLARQHNFSDIDGRQPAKFVW